MISGILEPRHGAVRRIINSVVAFHKSQQIEPYLEAFVADHLHAVLSASDGRRPGRRHARCSSSRFRPRPWLDCSAFPRPTRRSTSPGARSSARPSVRRPPRDDPSRCARRVRSWRATSRIASPSGSALPEADWPNDALSRFLTTEVEGERLTPRAVTTQIMFSIGAGSDTTRNVLGSLLYRLAVDPELYQRSEPTGRSSSQPSRRRSGSTRRPSSSCAGVWLGESSWATRSCTKATS